MAGFVFVIHCPPEVSLVIGLFGFLYKGQSMEVILKMETTSLLMKLMERKKDYDDKLVCNNMALGDRVVMVKAGEDNRWTLLHYGRFLAGATCSASRMWLTARERMGVAGHAPVGSYDLGALGMGGLVTSRGWVELHNPRSCKISLRMFSIKFVTSLVLK